MSYDLFIMRPPVPAGEDAAWKAMEEAAEIEPHGEIPDVFHQMIDCLTRRYPCICDLPDDKVDDGVWSDGPLRNNCTPAYTALGIVWSRVEEVQPFVVETANNLGLIVFDQQQSKIFRPTGGAPESSRVFVRPWWKFWG